MDWKDLLIYILECLCGFIITVGIPYGVSLLRTKIKNEQLARVLDRAAKIVSDSVQLINQTYVDALKYADMFDEEAQKEAFELCKSRVIALLNQESVKAIYDTYGDFEEWLRTMIESNVRQEKLILIDDAEDEQE